MVEEGTTDVTDDWSVVLDITDGFDSKISSLAIADAEKTQPGDGWPQLANKRIARTGSAGLQRRHQREIG